MAFDVYLVGRHQRAANWIYTLWGLSPYKVGAQCFAVGGILGVIDFMLEPEPSPMGLGSTLLLASLWFWKCIARDRDWQRNRLFIEANVWWVIVGLRYLFALVTVTMVLALAAVIVSNGDATVPKMIITLREIALTSGFYFYSCQPPTRIERRDPRLVPQSAG